MTLAPLVARHRIVVCVGSGGVGKTTVAATLALHAASQGRRAMVLTIDPARRLAQSLGLRELRSEGQRIDPELLNKHLQQVKTGVPGMAYLRLDPEAQWPARLTIKVPQ